MARIKIGDVVEIRTSKGLAYAHYSHKHSMYGALLRVFGTLVPQRPASFSEIVQRKPSFLCFFPLGAAVNRHLVEIVVNLPLPSEAVAFPIFRAGVADRETRKVATWWLWNGEREWKVGALTSEHKKLSIRGIWNDTLLIERIEAGWTPESDSTT